MSLNHLEFTLSEGRLRRDKGYDTNPTGRELNDKSFVTECKAKRGQKEESNCMSVQSMHQCHCFGHPCYSSRQQVQDYETQCSSCNHIHNLPLAFNRISHVAGRLQLPERSNIGDHSFNGQACPDDYYQTVSSRFNSKTRPEAEGPSPRSMSPVPTRLNKDELKTSHERLIASSQKKIDELKRELEYKTEEVRAATEQFDAMEAMIRRLHEALQEEKERNRHLEEELINVSRGVQARGKSSSSSNLDAIEKKYRELKVFVEKTNLSNESKSKTYENNLSDCFELFAGIFESIVMNKHQKNQAYEEVQNKIMSFFENHNALIAKFGYQEKLIQVLREYQLRKSASSKKLATKDFNPRRLDQRFDQEDKENLARLRHHALQPDDGKYHQQQVARFSNELDSSDSLTNYELQLQH